MLPRPGDECIVYEGYTDFVDVEIIWTDISGAVITMVIKVNGYVIWVGGLKAGESTPTITTGGYTEYITIKVNWTYPPNIILGLIVTQNGTVIGVWMLRESDPN